MKILQISDTHFGTERAAVCRALCRLFVAARPDLLIVCGDVTQRATRRQFSRARRYFDSLQAPARLIVPGNHDIPLFNPVLRFLAPYRRYAAAFGHVREAEHVDDDAHVVTLDTTRRWRHVDGHVSAAQIERVVHAFADARAGQWRVVVVHQPVAVTRVEDYVNLLHGAESAVRRWATGGVDLVLGGHIHLPYVLPLDAAWPGLGRPMWAVQAGTALSTRVRAGAPNSVNLLHLSGGTGSRHARIERWDYAGDDAGFTCVHTHALVTDAA